MFTVRVTGNKWWEDRVYYLSHGGLENIGVMPMLKRLDRAFRQTLTALFKPGGGPGTEYEHGYTGRYLTNLRSVVTPTELKIVEGIPTGGREIRTGGPPGSYDEIVRWAREKLGVGDSAAGRIASALEGRGFVGGGDSPIQREYPGGARRFAYPEWIVEVKNKRDIERASRTVETLVVEYLR